MRIHLGKSYEKKPILHINKIGIDNRYTNLMYDIANKPITKNIKKKKRIINLPKNSNIPIDSIPSFVWYIKPDLTHGPRFMVKIGDFQWKSTSLPELSLRYKLESAKKYLRYIKNTYPEELNQIAMNGDLNIQGQILSKEFFTIINSKYKHLFNIHKISYSDDMLEESHQGLTQNEIILLNEQIY